jgi:hypothetical protein
MGARGGARPGAGRKSSAVKAFAKGSAAEILAGINEKIQWKKFLKHKDPKIGLDALKYLTDQRDGRAAQAVLVSGNPDVDTPIGVIVDL